MFPIPVLVAGSALLRAKVEKSAVYLIVEKMENKPRQGTKALPIPRRLPLQSIENQHTPHVQPNSELLSFDVDNNAVKSADFALAVSHSEVLCIEELRTDTVPTANTLRDVDVPLDSQFLYIEENTTESTNPILSNSEELQTDTSPTANTLRDVDEPLDSQFLYIEENTTESTNPILSHSEVLSIEEHRTDATPTPNIFATYKWVELPLNWECYSGATGLVFLRFSNDRKSILKQIHVTCDDVEVFIGAHMIRIEKPVDVTEEATFLKFLQTVENISSCKGNSGHCLHFVQDSREKCPTCGEEDRERNRNERRRNNVIHSLRNENKNYKEEMIDLQRKFDKLKKEKADLLMVLNEFTRRNFLSGYEKLPANQQIVLKECFKNANSSVNGRRYSSEWLYLSILLRIRGRSAYEHLRHYNILPLPCINTIGGYLKNLESEYGFQAIVFNLMKEKGKDMPDFKKRGSLLIDEMKVSESISFNKETLRVAGFVELGENNTNEQDRVTAGDHALVFMFQPFAGGWIQVIGSFLSKNAAKGDVLHSLIIEAVALLENAGFAVDCIVTDGATWNRRMWRLFGIDENKVSCTHPMSDTRLLFFASDFPHLVKNIRNYIVTKSYIQTPSGEISLLNWQTILQLNRVSKYGLACCPKLTDHHISSKQYEKMSVTLAYQFFGEDVFAFMELLLEKNIHPLVNGLGCITFVRLMNSLIKAMSSRTPKNALKDNSPEKKIIEECIRYMRDWRAMSLEHAKELAYQKKLSRKRKREELLNKETSASTSCANVASIEDIQIDEDEENNELDEDEEYNEFDREENDEFDRHEANTKKYFLSSSTLIGLLVTLQTSLQLFQYLAENFNFEYLMLSRINQDNLERFFSMMRHACGCNDQPSSAVFIRVFKLLMTYSLVKPIKGSNVDQKQDVMDALIQTKEIRLNKKKTAQEKWKIISDLILSHSDSFQDVDFEMDYTDDTIYDNIVQYMAGYVLLKAKKFVNCDVCDELLRESRSESSCVFIEARDLHGKIKRPSNKLTYLIDKVEEIIIMTLDHKKMHSETFFEIMYSIEDKTVLPEVGCTEHSVALTKRIIYFYVSVRLHFICKVISNDINNKEKIRNLKKQAKLC